MQRPRLATGLVAVCILAAVVLVAAPAWQAYDARTQGQQLASKVLTVCGQGGDAAAPLIAAGACPLARQVSSTAPASPAQGVTSEQVQDMINEAIARQKAAPAPPPAIMPEGGALPNPFIPPGVAGPPGREQYQPQPAPPEVRSTEAARPPPWQFQQPASARRTVTEMAPPPVTVTEPPPVTVTQTAAPAPITQTVEQPVQQPAAPAQQPGVPLLNGVGGLLNGIGNGL